MGRKTHNTAGATRFDDFKRTPEAFPECTKPVETRRFYNKCWGQAMSLAPQL